MKFCFILILSLLFARTLSGENLIEHDYEIDAYYTNVSTFIDLEPDRNITNAIDMSERDIYTQLLNKAFSPNIFLFEASCNPMAILGLYVRKQYNNLYDESNVQDMNLVKVITAGFEEPYSFSFFVGRMMIFKTHKNDRVGKNRAYMGVLVDIGDKTIKDNVAYNNKWMDIEYKLKGTRAKTDVDLDWSFRVGAKINGNKNFVNSLYIGARRSSIDYKKNIYSLRYNSAFSTMIALSADTFKLINYEIILEKKIPISGSEKMSFGIGIGYRYNSGNKYRGTLKEEGIDNHQLLIRPNLKW